MGLRFTLFLLSGLVSFFCLSAERLDSGRKVNAWIRVGDYHQAIREGARVVGQHPDSLSAWKGYLTALAKAGDEKRLLAEFAICRQKIPHLSSDRELMETVAWGILDKGIQSPSASVRLFAALGAFLGQDAKSLSVLKLSLRDSNPQLRAVGCTLAANFRDETLQKEVLVLAQSDPHPLVRTEAIKTLGKVKWKQAEGLLISRISNAQTRDEEKAAAIEALVNMMEKASRSEIQRLTSSLRAGLRELACRVVLHTADGENADLIVPLLQDHCSDVRCSAVQTLGFLRYPDFEILAPLLNDPDPYTAISASWAATINRFLGCREALAKWVRHPDPKIRRFASGVLHSTGGYGLPFMTEEIKSNRDLFVCANLALGLVGQREALPLASAALSDALQHLSERMMWKQNGIFRYLDKSEVRHTPLFSGQPELSDQMTRLEVLNVLVIMDEPSAVPAVENFLKSRDWGVTGTAAALLLTEGGDEWMDIVARLLQAPDEKIRIQGALILALWGRDESALAVLEAIYPVADREMKERILEGIGQVGHERSIPMLLGALQDSSQQLRMMAAASLLRCLYH